MWHHSALTLPCLVALMEATAHVHIERGASLARLLRWCTYNSSNSLPVETISSLQLCCWWWMLLYALLLNAWCPNRQSHLRLSTIPCNQGCWRSPAALIAVECWLTLVGTAST